MAADVDLLVVDDREQDLLAITSILACPDYNLVTASTATEALRQVLTQDFAVILLDVFMPEMTGFELAEVIRRRDRSRHTPIIFLTAAGSDVGSIYRGYSVGAVDYLVKPIDADVLRAKAAIFVDLFRKDRRIKEQAETLRAADRRQREHELTELKVAGERRYRDLAEAIPQIVWIADPDGAVTYFNQRWFEHTAQGAEEARGSGWKAAMHPDDLERWTERWHEALAAPRVVELECRLRHVDAGYRWHLCRAVPERRKDGQIAGWLGTYTDVDDRRRAFDAVEAALHARDEFLSIASHELRTPLMTLQLRLQSLERSLLPHATDPAAADRLRHLLASAVRQGARMADLVENLLDVTRITNGRLTLQRERLDLAEAAREVLERFAETAARAGCDLDLRIERPAVGTWDRLRIEQVLQNLVANAIKYAPKTRVEIEVSTDAGGAALTVRDRGVGIAPADVERIFGQFERAVPARHFGGLGLGLYISRQIAHAHGGSIRVTSAPGEGSTFVVSLPLGPELPTDGPRSASGDGAGRDP